MGTVRKLTDSINYNRVLKSKTSLLFSILFVWMYFLEVQVVSAVSNVLVEKLHIFSIIRYRYGQTKVFCEMHNHGLQAEEASFAMILPEDAFVSYFKMQVGVQMYNSFIEQRDEANAIYSEDRRLGKSAGIINEEANIFNISINLEANKTVIFHLEYEEEIVPKNGRYELAISVMPQEAESKHFCVDIEIIEFKNFSIEAANLCANSCVTIDLEKETVGLYRTRSKRIIWEPTKVPGKMQELRDKMVLGKYKITYLFHESETINEVLINNGYFVHRFSPRGLDTIPLHVIFVLDISESMLGQRKEQLTEAMMTIFDDLKSHDYFSIVTFSTESNIWKPFKGMHEDDGLAAFKTDFTIIESAKSQIKNLRYHGSTNIYAALMDALKIANQSARKFENYLVNSKHNYVKPTPIVIFLTDGKATSGVIEEKVILEKVRENNFLQDSRIFCLAFGSTADYDLLHKLSLQNGGFARRIFDNNAADLLKDFYTFVGSPVLKNLTFQYISEMKLLDFTSQLEPWISVKGEISVAGRIELDNHYESDHKIINVTVSGEGSNNTQKTFKVYNCICGGFCSPNPGQYDQIIIPSEENDSYIDQKCGDGKDHENSFLEKFWVHKTLRKLISQVKEGNDTVKRRILELAMKYKFVTPFTSLVVRTPYDPTSNSSKKIIQPQPLSNLLIRDINRKGLSNAGIPKPKNSNPVNKWTDFSIHNSLGSEKSKQLETLTVHLEKLIVEQGKAISLAEQEQLATTHLNKILILDDIQWLNSTGNKLILLNQQEGRSYNFQILKTLQRSQQTFPYCKVLEDGTDLPIDGKCTHLVNCVRKQFLEDRELFVKNYFCPLIGNYGKFVGACCTG